MLDPRNVVNISGGLTADPEKPTENIVKFRIGVDYSGNDSKNHDNKSGYFDVTYFLNTKTPNAEFVGRQISEGKLKKGSKVQILGRLLQERWESDGRNASKVVIVAESLSYQSAPNTQSTAQSSSTSGEPVAAASSSSVPNEF